MTYTEAYRKIVRREGWWFWAAWILQPAVFLYFLGSMLNRYAFSLGLRKRRSFNTVIVSVGNIEAGGVGKTPVTLRIAGRLSGMGLKTAVVCGNTSAKKAPPIAVRPGSSYGGTAPGDEAILLGRALNGLCSVYTGSDKAEAVERAVRETAPDVVVVDDGFQHHKLKRDLDVVVLNADHPFGQGGLLPAGTLRESPWVLSNADYVWVNGITSDAQLTLAKRLVSTRNWKAPCVASSVVPGKPLKHDGSTCRIGRVVAFCGIGKPEGFRHTLERTGFAVERFHIYPDHWNYTRHDMNYLRGVLEQSGADYLITTEKDAARLGDAAVKTMDLRVLPIRLEIVTPQAEEELLGSVLELVGKYNDHKD